MALAALHFPAAHGAQRSVETPLALEASLVAYLPAVHWKQVAEPSAATSPASQATHSVFAVPEEYVLTPQSSHFGEALALMYLPAGHCVQLDIPTEGA